MLSVGESLKDSLRAEGAEFDESEIDELINQSIQNIISNPDSFLTESLPKQRGAAALFGGIAAGVAAGITGGAAIPGIVGLAMGLYGTPVLGAATGAGLGFGLNSTYSVSFDTKALTDRFFDEFDQLYTVLLQVQLSLFESEVIGLYKQFC